MTESSDDVVVPGYECPGCKERRMDLLVWIDDEEVRCESCGMSYGPGTGETHSRGKVQPKGDRDARDDATS